MTKRTFIFLLSIMWLNTHAFAQSSQYKLFPKKDGRVFSKVNNPFVQIAADCPQAKNDATGGIIEVCTSFMDEIANTILGDASAVKQYIADKHRGIIGTVEFKERTESQKIKTEIFIYTYAIFNMKTGQIVHHESIREEYPEDSSIENDYKVMKSLAFKVITTVKKTIGQ